MTIARVSVGDRLGRRERMCVCVGGGRRDVEMNEKHFRPCDENSIDTKFVRIYVLLLFTSVHSVHVRTYENQTKSKEKKTGVAKSITFN